MEISEYIPKENFNKWMTVFMNTSGRFLCNPCYKYSKDVYVRYTFNNNDDCQYLNDNYKRLTTNIRDTKRSWIKKMLIKLGL